MEIQIVVFEMWLLNLNYLGKKKFPPKFKLSYIFSYRADFDKIGVILKEIAHRCHFCNKILFLSM